METIRETHLPFADNLLKLSDVYMGFTIPVSLLCVCLSFHNKFFFTKRILVSFTSFKKNFK